MSIETIQAPELPEPEAAEEVVVEEAVAEPTDPDALVELELEVGDHENALFDTRFRCDKGECGAQAYIRATLKSGNELYFCNHHGIEVSSVLKPQCKEWYTEANRLIEDKKKGSEN
jgi:hypothetical protein